MSSDSLTDFLAPLNKAVLNFDEDYQDSQIGSLIDIYETTFPDIDAADVVIVGAGEERGEGISSALNPAPDIIRQQFYKLFHWHQDIKLADLGNLQQGDTLADSYAALSTVVKELTEAGKRVIIIGGSHDLTYAQYQAYARQEKIIEATVIDALIDLSADSQIKSQNFLMEMLTEQPNFIRHYNHIGFQSYDVHPLMLETLDKLRFDCYRLGKVRENMEEMEPVIRHSEMLSFDINAIRHSDAPSNKLSPNGFHGDEACLLSRYAGMASRLSSIGIYGYHPSKDEDEITARQVAQFLWYFIDGFAVYKKESPMADKDNFLHYHTSFSGMEATFIKSKKTGRWWMQMPDRQYIPCSYADYLTASHDQIPERWLRAQERF